MFRDKVGFLIPILAVVATLVVAADASACRRCGRSRCVYAAAAPVYHQHVNHVHQHVPPDVTNFVFNNVFPTPYLQADQGSSVFGYSLAAQSYRFDPNQYLDRSARLQELSIENQRLGQEGSSVLASQALAVQSEFNRTFANTAAFQALMAANGGDGGGAGIQSYRVTVQGGELKVEKIDVGGSGNDGGGGNGRGDNGGAYDPGPGNQPGGADDGPPRDDLPAGGGITCFGCHGGGNELATKAIRLDPLVAIDDADRERINLAVMEGRMPPKSSLTAQQRAALLAQLCKLPSK